VGVDRTRLGCVICRGILGFSGGAGGGGSTRTISTGISTRSTSCRASATTEPAVARPTT
jgi:hypothetical protein